MAQCAMVALVMLAAAPSPAPSAMPMSGEACGATAVLPPAPLAGWQDRIPIRAAAGTGDLAGAAILPGRPVDVALSPTPDVTYSVRPAHPGGSVSHGGMLLFTVARPGIYRVAIGSAAWIDLVRDGQAVASIAHSPGPACSGVRKMVDFTLRPGPYVLEIAGNGSPQLALLVARLP